MRRGEGLKESVGLMTWFITHASLRPESPYLLVPKDSILSNEVGCKEETEFCGRRGLVGKKRNSGWSCELEGRNQRRQIPIPFRSFPSNG